MNAISVRRNLILGIILLLAGALGMSSNGLADLQDGLVGYWSFDEGTGGTAHDHSGYNNHGTINGATWTTGVSGSSLDFDGVDDYVNVGSGESLECPTVTVSAWVKRNVTGVRHTMVGTSNPARPDREHYLHFEIHDSDRLVLLFGDGIMLGDAWSIGTITDPNWHHVVVVRDDGADSVRFSFDGVAEPFQPYANHLGQLVTLGSDDMWIGKCNVSEISYAPFNGTIDEVRIYNRALTEDEIEYLYNNPGGNQPPTALIDDISPNPAELGQEVAFVGLGEDTDGSIIAWEWTSSIDGLLSDQASFGTYDLTPGTHVIYFKVQDDDGEWSEEVSQVLEIESGPAFVVESIDWDPEAPGLSSHYIIDVVVRNPSEYERKVKLTLKETDQNVVGGIVTWPLGGNFPEQAADAEIIPSNQTTTLSFKFCPTWNWIEPWDWTRVFSALGNYMALVGYWAGVEIPPDIEVTFDVLTANSVNVAHLVQYTIDDVYPSTVDVIPQNINIGIPLPKVIMLFTSYGASVTGTIFTFIGIITCGPMVFFCLEFYFMEACWLAIGECMYLLAADPDSDYTVMVTPEFPPTPELDTLPESHEKYLAYAVDSVYAFSKAMGQSYAKFLGAEQDTAYYWEVQQLEAACGFAKEVNRLIVDSRLNLAETDMSRLPLDSARITAAYDYLVTHGLPEYEDSVLWRLGVSEAEVDSLTVGLTMALENGSMDTLPSISSGLRAILAAGESFEVDFRAKQFDVKINKMGEFVQPVSPDTIQYLEDLSQDISNRISQGDDDSATWALIDSLHSVSLSIANASNDTTVLQYYRKALQYNATYYDTSSNLIGLPPPLKPEAPSGLTLILAGESCGFSSVTSDPDTEQIFYMFDWDDQMSPLWLGPFESDIPCTTFHSWSQAGSYKVKVKACDQYYHVSDWSDSLLVTVWARGDANGDGVIGPADVVHLINYLFRNGSAPEPLEAGDCNCDGSVGPGDVVYLINYLFRGGPPPGCS